MRNNLNSRMIPKPGERDITAKEMRNIISAMDEP